MTAIGALTLKLQKAESLAAGGRERGMACTYQPDGSNFSRHRVRPGGEVEEIPRTHTGDDVGFFRGRSPG